MRKSIIENSVVAYLGDEDSPDITNPIHSTEFAKVYGFTGPLVGGVTVWGWATDTILEALGENWLVDGWAEYSFRQPTFPGDILLIRATLDSKEIDECWDIQMINQEHVVCVLGKVGVGKAAWSQELVRSRNMQPRQDSPEKSSLTLLNAEVGKDWTALRVNLSQELSTEFTTKKQLTDLPLFVGSQAIAHPSWIAGWAEQLLRHNFDIPSSMHTRSWVQHHRKIPIGTSVIGGAHLIEVYERKAHHFATFDVLLQDDQGTDIAQLRHWTIFKIATLDERAAIS